MNHKITALAVMLLLVGFMASCVSNDTDSTYYNDAMITAVSLGNVKCTRTIKKSDGTDSTYTYTYSASSAYPLTVDQINGTICNIDSLVVGSNVSNILTTISTKNNGTVLIKSLENDSLWSYYSSSDSINYSSDRVFRVWSADGNVSKDYKVHINVHQQNGDSFQWDAVKTTALPAACTNISSATMLDNTMYIVLKGQPNILYASTDGATWTAKTIEGTATENDSVVASANGKIYMVANGQLFESADASSWSNVCDASTLLTLCGGTASELFAVTKGRKLVSLKKGTTSFEDEDIESSANVTAYLPYKDVNFCSTTVKTNSEISRYIMVANTDTALLHKTFPVQTLTLNDVKYTQKICDDSTAVVWNKIEDDIMAQPWTHTIFNWNNHYYTLPNMKGVTAVYYGDGLYAMGGAATNVNATSAFSCLYYSPDCGTTWHKDSNVALPSDYSATEVKAAKLLTDGKTLYLIALTDGNLKVWTGRQNKLGWNDVTTYFK